MKINWRPLIVHLPVLLAVFIDTHVQLFRARRFGSEHPFFVDVQVFGGEQYSLLLIQQLLECAPYFIAAYAFHTWCFDKPIKATLALLAGFGVYPLLSYIVAHYWSGYGLFTLLNVQGWSLAIIGTMMWWLNRFIQVGHNQLLGRWVSTLFSLNGVVISLLLVWTFLLSGIFMATPDPMRNMPLNTIIDVSRIANEFGLFVSYIGQFGFIALLMFGFYLFIRFCLIRELLAKQGVLVFILGALLSILILTPIAGALVLMLPINIDSMTLLVSTDHDVFGSDNYMFSIVLLGFCVPLSLAFERQKQDALFAKHAQHQTKTELQLLQQQINPHFLFNTLNNLYALTLKKADSAPDMIIRLSDLLRYTVYQGQKTHTSVLSEVNYLQNYLKLQSIRLGSRCEIKTSWPSADTTEHINISPLLFIILLENAFKHGIETTSHNTVLNVSLKLVYKPDDGDNQYLVFMVENESACNNTSATSVSSAASNTISSSDYRGSAEGTIKDAFKNVESETGGLGLINLRRRLTLLYADKFVLSSLPLGAGRWQSKLEIQL